VRPDVAQVEQPLHAVQPALAGRLIGVPPVGGAGAAGQIATGVRRGRRPHDIDAVEGRQQRVRACGESPGAVEDALQREHSLQRGTLV